MGPQRPVGNDRSTGVLIGCEREKSRKGYREGGRERENERDGIGGTRLTLIAFRIRETSRTGEFEIADSKAVFLPSNNNAKSESVEDGRRWEARRAGARNELRLTGTSSSKLPLKSQSAKPSEEEGWWVDASFLGSMSAAGWCGKGGREGVCELRRARDEGGRRGRREGEDELIPIALSTTKRRGEIMVSLGGLVGCWE